MPGYSATVLADSVSPAGDRLTTMEVCFPRIVLAEFNTHRVFSRNSASGRAIPLATQIQRILDFPFVPEYWGRNQPGMQAEVPLEGEDREHAIVMWLAARDNAVHWARGLGHVNVHKQTVNRLLEPFMWHTVIITATEWSNFFALRANPAAQPEIRTVAELMLEAFNNSTPQLINEGEWHLPLLQPEELSDTLFRGSSEARKISAARCARVSYLTHDGQRNLQADLDLYERLVADGHLSPLEHVATPFTEVEWHTRDGMADAAIEAADDSLPDLSVNQLLRAVQFSGNFRGWNQLRKQIENEDDFGLAKRS